MRARIHILELAASACLALAAALVLPRFAHAQAPHRDLPPHAHYVGTEQGWACNDGFRQIAGFCIQDSVDMPSQGPFEVFDGQWRCRSGYKRSGAFCVTPTAPAHATLIDAAGHWECDWGFRKVASRCEEVLPPAHGYVDAEGHDWLCYPGYQRSSDQCLPGSGGAGTPEVPESAPPPRAGTAPPAPAEDSKAPAADAQNGSSQ